MKYCCFLSAQNKTANFFFQTQLKFLKINCERFLTVKFVFFPNLDHMSLRTFCFAICYNLKMFKDKNVCIHQLYAGHSCHLSLILGHKRILF